MVLGVGGGGGGEEMTGIGGKSQAGKQQINLKSTGIDF
jgi:hypothetical protein